MFHWYGQAVAALLLLGLQRFLYKVAAANNCSTLLTTFSFMGTVAVMSTVLIFALSVQITDLIFLVLVSLANSLAFLISTLSHIQALKYVSASLAYPIIRLNIAIVVLFSVVIFKDKLNIWQWLGILTSAAAIWVLTRGQHSSEAQKLQYKKGLLLVVLATISGAGAIISSKYAAVYSNKISFIALSYIFSSLLSLVFYSKMFGSSSLNLRPFLSVGIGIGMGILNLGGYYIFLQALTTGPLSIVASITGMHFVVAVVLSVVIYKDQLSFTGIIGLFLTSLALILLHGL